MTSLEERMRQGLDVLVPSPDDVPMSWEDALRRAERAPVRVGRPLVTRGRGVALALALAAAALVVLALSPVGGAIARGFGDFSAWLTGSPGEPASQAEQRAFDKANKRSWMGASHASSSPTTQAGSRVLGSGSCTSRQARSPRSSRTTRSAPTR